MFYSPYKVTVIHNSTIFSIDNAILVKVKLFYQNPSNALDISTRVSLHNNTFAKTVNTRLILHRINLGRGSLHLLVYRCRYWL